MDVDPPADPPNGFLIPHGRLFRGTPPHVLNRPVGESGFNRGNRLGKAAVLVALHRHGADQLKPHHRGAIAKHVVAHGPRRSLEVRPAEQIPEQLGEASRHHLAVPRPFGVEPRHKAVCARLKERAIHVIPAGLDRPEGPSLREDDGRIIIPHRGRSNARTREARTGYAVAAPHLRAVNHAPPLVRGRRRLVGRPHPVSEHPAPEVHPLKLAIGNGKLLFKILDDHPVALGDLRRILAPKLLMGKLLHIAGHRGFFRPANRHADAFLGKGLDPLIAEIVKLPRSGKCFGVIQHDCPPVLRSASRRKSHRRRV